MQRQRKRSKSMALVYQSGSTNWISLKKAAYKAEARRIPESTEYLPTGRRRLNHTIVVRIIGRDGHSAASCRSEEPGCHERIL
jgi:hypothetical protein